MVVDGMEVLTVLEAVATTRGDKPVMPVVVDACGELLEDSGDPASEGQVEPLGAVVNGARPSEPFSRPPEPEPEPEPELSFEEQTDGMTPLQKRLFGIRMKVEQP
jgi:hypothetical protein